MDKLIEVLDRCWDEKDNLNPQAGAHNRKQLMDFIRASFPLEKKDCQTIFTCLLVLVVRVVDTKKSAEKVFPRFKKLVPHMFKASSYNSVQIAYGKIRTANRLNQKQSKPLRTKLSSQRLNKNKCRLGWHRSQQKKNWRPLCEPVCLKSWSISHVMQPAQISTRSWRPLSWPPAVEVSSC